MAVASPAPCLASQCVLSGSWRSDDGGRAVVSVLEPDGSFLGSYVPAAGGPQAVAWPLKGVQQDVALAAQPVFSFLVHRGPHGAPGGRTTAFVGQCYVDEAGEEALHALWLLRDAVQSPGQDWKATRIGTSVFTRIK
ncbi:avidin-like [Nothoprocta perdicaria]|uniref:avidin-like n=1 Tax=Nothoprocta perdicaria TaxID=30464 RepID=UPI000E1B8F96|nr:avidin-like [Nothoprocta perdicaria]